MSSNSVCNHTRDKQIRLPLRGRPILLSLVWLQTELDSIQSYYHYLLNISVLTRKWTHQTELALKHRPQIMKNRVHVSWET